MMKSKILVLLLFLLIIAFTTPVYSNSYFNYERFGSTWYDANKTLSNTLDDPFCTTAAASNVLKYGGWDAGLTTSDAIFTEFLNLWASSDIPLTVINSWALWLNGKYIHWISWPTDYEWLTDPFGRGNFYPNNPFESYYYIEIDQSNTLSAAANFLRNGYGVALTIQVGGDIMQHTVTLWGYDYDAQGNFLGIWITDSDDYYPDPDNPQPKLSYYNVNYNQSDYKWWIDGYQIASCPWWGTNFYIQAVRALDRNPAAFFPVAFFDDFSQDKGWVGFGPGGWERGPAAVGGGENGYPDSDTDYSGFGDNYILGFAIGGDYPNNMTEESIISPPIDCTRLDRVFLKFWRYLNVQNNYSDHAKIYVSNDGTNWTQLWENPVFDLMDNQWTQVVFDISTIAANQPTLYIKFAMGPTDSSFRFSGWNIDDVEITSVCPSIGTASLISPSNGSSRISTTPTLDWSDVSGATSYDVQVCTDSSCTSVVRSATIGGSQWQVSPALNPQTQYWWYVRANNPCGSGSWSSIWSFITIQTYFEENDPTITYTGNWNTYTSPSCSGGTMEYSNQTGAKAQFSFTGTGIKWIVTRAKMMGKATVYLDGVYMRMVDLYSSTPQFQVVLQKTGLSSGTHSIVIKVSGLKNPNATGYNIGIDAFEIVP